MTLKIENSKLIRESLSQLKSLGQQTSAIRILSTVGERAIRAGIHLSSIGSQHCPSRRLGGLTAVSSQRKVIETEVSGDRTAPARKRQEATLESLEHGL